MEQPAFVVPLGWGKDRYLIAAWYVLPFCLYLPHDHYEVRISELNEGRPALIQLDKRMRDPEIPFKMLPAGKGERWRDPTGKFRYSTAVVWMPYTDDASTDLKPLLHFLPTETYRVYSLQYLNRLVRVYRFVTRDYYIPTVAMEDVSDYFGIGIADRASTPSKMEWLPMGRGQPDVNLLPDKPPKQIREMKEMLRTEASIPDQEELLMSARDLRETGSPRLAVLEAQTAFEVVVTGLVAQHYRDHGYSQEQIENKLECGFKNLLKHHLNAKVKRFEDGMPVHDDYWAETYKPRCALVHGRSIEITDQEAEQAIHCVEKALEYLIGRPQDRIWPPEQPPLQLM